MKRDRKYDATLGKLEYDGKTYGLRLDIDSHNATVTVTAEDSEGVGPRTMMHHPRGDKVTVKDGKVIIGENIFSPEFEGTGGLKKIYLVKEKGLEGKMPAVLTLGGVILGLGLFSSNLTGNAIADLTIKTSNMIGAGIFVLGIVGSYFYFRKK